MSQDKPGVYGEPLDQSGPYDDAPPANWGSGPDTQDSHDAGGTPDPRTDTTGAATVGAVAAGTVTPLSEAKDNPEIPTAGEQDGRFYFTKNVAQEDGAEIPERVHQDNIEDVKLQARNQGWLPLDEPDSEHPGSGPMVDNAVNMGDHWVVTYSVPVKRNQIEIPKG